MYSTYYPNHWSNIPIFFFFGKLFTLFKLLKSKFFACFSQYSPSQEHCLISHILSANKDDYTKAAFVTFEIRLNNKHVSKRDKKFRIASSTSSWLFIITILFKSTTCLEWFHQNWTFSSLVVYPGNLRLYLVDFKKWSTIFFFFFIRKAP